MNGAQKILTTRMKPQLLLKSLKIVPTMNLLLGRLSIRVVVTKALKSQLQAMSSKRVIPGNGERVKVVVTATATTTMARLVIRDDQMARDMAGARVIILAETVAREILARAARTALPQAPLDSRARTGPVLATSSWRSAQVNGPPQFMFTSRILIQ